MSMNDTILSDQLLQLLYPSQLVIPDMIPAPAQLVNAGYAVLGSNKKNICLLANAPGTSFLNDADQQFIDKVLAACKLSGKDVAIINMATAPVSFQNLQEQLKPTKLLLFGVAAAGLGLDIRPALFEVQTVDGCIVCQLPAVADICRPGIEGTALKTRLWTALKSLFEI